MALEITYTEWEVVTGEHGERVAVHEINHSVVTDEWRQEYQEELCEWDLMEDDERAELELQYLYDRLLDARCNLAKIHQSLTVTDEAYMKASLYEHECWLDWREAADNILNISEPGFLTSGLSA